MKLLKVYARSEPTLDKLIPHRKDVQIYKDRAHKKPYARFMWWQKKPTRRSKTVTINCYEWEIIWL